MYIGPIGPQYTFRFTVSYAGEVDYTVYGDGQPYVITLFTKHALDDYWRRVYNGTEEDWQRNQVSRVNTIIREHCYKREPIPHAVVDAFNAWRLARARYWRHKLLSDPVRYGTFDPDNLPEWLCDPEPVRAIHFFADPCTKCRESWKCELHCKHKWQGLATTWPLTPTVTVHENYVVTHETA